MTTALRLLTVLLWSFLLLLPAWSEEFSGKVVRVMDGDTIAVLHDLNPERIRLAGIDAPEKRQAYGQQAKNFVANQCFGQIVTIVSHGHDRYGRTIGDVILSDGSSLNKELVQDGYAWWYQKYAPHDIELQNLQDSARSSQEGLWADPYAMPPWEFRHRSRLSTNNP